MNNVFESYIYRLSFQNGSATAESSYCRYVLTIYPFHIFVIRSNGTFTYIVPHKAELLSDFLVFIIPTSEDAGCVLD